MFKPISNDLFLVGETILLLFELIAGALLIVFVYLTFVGGALYQPERIGARGSRASRLAVFIASSISTLAAAHALLYAYGLLPAIIWLAIGIPGSVMVYWALVRAINRPDDMRIPYTGMVLGSTAFLSFGALLTLWVLREHVKLETDARLSIDTLVHVAAIALSAISFVFAYVMKSDQSTRTAKQQIYQSLELQSIELFRFEANNSELVSKLWDAETLPVEPKERYQLKQYVCQMLNLFEMAYRFRVTGIMDPAIFGSWVIWIWELSNAPVFSALWSDKQEGLPLNYVPEFREAVDIAICVAEQPGHVDRNSRRRLFFEKLAELLSCSVVESWLEPQSSRQMSKLRS